MCKSFYRIFFSRYSNIKLVTRNNSSQFTMPAPGFQILSTGTTTATGIQVCSTSLRCRKGQHYQIFEVINITLFNAKEKLPSRWGKRDTRKFNVNEQNFLNPKFKKSALFLKNHPTTILTQRTFPRCSGIRFLETCLEIWLCLKL